MVLSSVTSSHRFPVPEFALSLSGHNPKMLTFGSTRFLSHTAPAASQTPHFPLMVLSSLSIHTIFQYLNPLCRLEYMLMMLTLWSFRFSSHTVLWWAFETPLFPFCRWWLYLSNQFMLQIFTFALSLCDYTLNWLSIPFTSSSIRFIQMGILKPPFPFLFSVNCLRYPIHFLLSFTYYLVLLCALPSSSTIRFIQFTKCLLFLALLSYRPFKSLHF